MPRQDVSALAKAKLTQAIAPPRGAMMQCFVRGVGYDNPEALAPEFIAETTVQLDEVSLVVPDRIMFWHNKVLKSHREKQIRAAGSAGLTTKEATIAEEIHQWCSKEANHRIIAPLVAALLPEWATAQDIAEATEHWAEFETIESIALRADAAQRPKMLTKLCSVPLACCVLTADGSIQIRGRRSPIPKGAAGNLGIGVEWVTHRTIEGGERPPSKQGGEIAQAFDAALRAIDRAAGGVITPRFTTIRFMCQHSVPGGDAMVKAATVATLLHAFHHGGETTFDVIEAVLQRLGPAGKDGHFPRAKDGTKKFMRPAVRMAVLGFVTPCDEDVKTWYTETFQATRDAAQQSRMKGHSEANLSVICGHMAAAGIRCTVDLDLLAEAAADDPGGVMEMITNKLTMEHLTQFDAGIESAVDMWARETGVNATAVAVATKNGWIVEGIQERAYTLIRNVAIDAILSQQQSLQSVWDVVVAVAEKLPVGWGSAVFKQCGTHPIIDMCRAELTKWASSRAHRVSRLFTRAEGAHTNSLLFQIASSHSWWHMGDSCHQHSFGLQPRSLSNQRQRLLQRIAHWICSLLRGSLGGTGLLQWMGPSQDLLHQFLQEDSLLSVLQTCHSYS